MTKDKTTQTWSSKQLLKEYIKLRKQYKKIKRRLEIVENRYESIYAILTLDDTTKKWFVGIIDQLTNEMKSVRQNFKQKGGYRGLKNRQVITKDIKMKDKLDKELEDVRKEFKKKHKLDGLTGK